MLSLSNSAAKTWRTQRIVIVALFFFIISLTFGRLGGIKEIDITTIYQTVNETLLKPDETIRLTVEENCGVFGSFVKYEVLK